MDQPCNPPHLHVPEVGLLAQVCAHLRGLLADAAGLKAHLLTRTALALNLQPQHTQTLQELMVAVSCSQGRLSLLPLLLLMLLLLPHVMIIHLVAMPGQTVSISCCSALMPIKHSSHTAVSNLQCTTCQPALSLTVQVYCTASAHLLNLLWA
jgi:hypothetical protein